MGAKIRKCRRREGVWEKGEVGLSRASGTRATASPLSSPTFSQPIYTTFIQPDHYTTTTASPPRRVVCDDCVGVGGRLTVSARDSRAASARCRSGCCRQGTCGKATRAVKTSETGSMAGARRASRCWVPPPLYSRPWPPPQRTDRGVEMRQLTASPL